MIPERYEGNASNVCHWCGTVLDANGQCVYTHDPSADDAGDDPEKVKPNVREEEEQ